MGAEQGRAATENLGIAELLHAVRAELNRSEKMLKEKKIPALFRTRELELELNFVVKKSGEADAGVDLWVVTVGAGGSYATEQVQKIRLLLEAVDDRRNPKTPGINPAGKSSDQLPPLQTK